MKKNSKKKWFVCLAGVAVVAMVLLLAGCGQDSTSPLAPGGGGGGTNMKPGALQYVVDNYGDPFALDTTCLTSGGQSLAKTFKLKLDGDTATMGTEGGTLELQMQGFKSKLSVPKNALSGNTLMSVEGLLFSTPFGNLLLYDFGPDGLVFNVPSQLEVDAGQLKDNTWLSLLWLNPLTDEWEFQEQVQVKGHKIKFDVHHFSKYGIS